MVRCQAEPAGLRPAADDRPPVLPEGWHEAGLLRLEPGSGHRG